MRCLSSVVNLVAVTTLLLVLESAFYYLFCLKFSFRLVTSSKSYARKQKLVFFSEHSTYLNFVGKYFTLPFSEIRTVGLALDVVDLTLSFSAMTLFVGSYDP